MSGPASPPEASPDASAPTDAAAPGDPIGDSAHFLACFAAPAWTDRLARRHRAKEIGPGASAETSPRTQQTELRRWPRMSCATNVGNQSHKPSRSSPHQPEHGPRICATDCILGRMAVGILGWCGGVLAGAPRDPIKHRRMPQVPQACPRVLSAQVPEAVRLARAPAGSQAARGHQTKFFPWTFT